MTTDKEKEQFTEMDQGLLALEQRVSRLESRLADQSKTKKDNEHGPKIL